MIPGQSGNFPTYIESSKQGPNKHTPRLFVFGHNMLGTPHVKKSVADACVSNHHSILYTSSWKLANEYRRTEMSTFR